jgi:hypothetical protein
VRPRTPSIVLGSLAVLLLATGCGGNGEAPQVTPPTEARPPLSPPTGGPAAPQGAPQRVVLELEGRGDAAVSGRATLVAEEAETRIVVELDETPAEPAAAYLQEGDCLALHGGAVEHLGDVDAGRTETTVEATLTQLVNGRFTITVHHDDELQQPDACAEVQVE